MSDKEEVTTIKNIRENSQKDENAPLLKIIKLEKSEPEDETCKTYTLREKRGTLSKNSKNEEAALQDESSLAGGKSTARSQDVQREGTADNSFYIDINCNYVCRTCTTTYDSYTKFKLHEAEHHPKEGNNKNLLSVKKCPICSKEFLCSRELGRHKYRHKLVDIKKNEKKNSTSSVICNFCKMSFETVFELDLHKKAHLHVKMFPCEKCGFKFKSELQYSMHEALCTGKTEQYKTKPKKDNTSQNKQPAISKKLNHSVKYHHQVKYDHSVKISCKFCGCSFSSNSDLVSHIKECSAKCINNTKVWNFTADKVNKVSIQYQCLNCKFQFKTSEQLKLHQEVCSVKSIPNYGCNRKLNNKIQNQLSSEQVGLNSNKNSDLTQKLTDLSDNSSDDSVYDFSESDCNSDFSDVNKTVIKTEVDDQSYENDVTMNCENSDENQSIEKPVYSRKSDDLHMFLIHGENVKSVSDQNSSESVGTVESDLVLNKANASDLISSGAITVGTSDNEMYICAKAFQGPKQVKNVTISDLAKVKSEPEGDDDNFEMECGICGQFFRSYKSLRSHFDQHSL